jgi:glycosyltransferase involved in cell wall biosynthesis
MKGHKILMKAIRQFSLLAPNIKLVMAGRDVTTQNRELKSFIAEHDLEHLVVLLGEVSKTELLNPMFDVAVSSSSWGEGFSNTLGESMACGVPVITTNVGDSAMLVGDAGIIVEPNNPDALAQSLWSLYQTSETERIAISQRARARIVDHFTIDRMVTAYEHIFVQH